MIYQFRKLDLHLIPAAQQHLNMVVTGGDSNFYRQIHAKVDFLNTGHFYVVVYDQIDNEAFLRSFEYSATYLGGRDIHEAGRASPTGFYRSTVMGMCMFYDHLFKRYPNSCLAAESAYDDWDSSQVASVESAIFPDGSNNIYVLPSSGATIESIESLLRESKGFMGHLGAWSMIQEDVNMQNVDEWIRVFCENTQILHCHIFDREGVLIWSREELSFEGILRAKDESVG